MELKIVGRGGYGVRANVFLGLPMPQDNECALFEYPNPVGPLAFNVGRSPYPITVASFNENGEMSSLTVVPASDDRASAGLPPGTRYVVLGNMNLGKAISCLVKGTPPALRISGDKLTIRFEAEATPAPKPAKKASPPVPVAAPKPKAVPVKKNKIKAKKKVK